MRTTDHSNAIARTTGRSPAIIEKLPADEGSLLEAERFIAAAQQVLRTVGGRFLTAVGDDAGSVICYVFSSSETPEWIDLADARLPLNAAAARSLLTIQSIGRDLIGNLLRRWPAGAGPNRIGLLCDGHTLCVCPAEPDPTSPSWRHHWDSGQLSFACLGEVPNTSSFRILNNFDESSIH
ncbi:hypothetical protein B5C34_08850 [Pacificimonas flava]|uniref:Uncharacterized protein n=2 Tax=Pacificimonas TaxID=1960290 RepID=A0A219B5A2_9SPHN|nr:MULTISPECIES: hypothetical protein [Pacificimonas]MBZ6379226.1 hypothetical protein [Pacificimonas aurantium]OWV33560.1 hypothetical protein B5C34_08850 [Pacificimonas flava]